MPGQRVRLRLQVQHAFAQLLALCTQGITVNQHAPPFHCGQHRHERHFDVGVYLLQ